MLPDQLKFTGTIAPNQKNNRRFYPCWMNKKKSFEE